MSGIENLVVLERPGSATDQRLRRSIRAISDFQYFIGFAFLASSAFLGQILPADTLTWHHAGIPVTLGSGALAFVLARGLRRFKPWARTASIVITFVGALIFPLGMLICGPFLYVLIKAKPLFTPQPQPRSVPPEIDRLAA